ncbi:MAG: fumarylacetoacetase [Pseudonocardiales bacterium]|nr:fumarylacetoacetase [Pseudonocardiales bacterium]
MVRARTGFVTRCWLGVPDENPFGIDNLPYGMAALPNGTTRLVVRIGAWAFDVGDRGPHASLDALFAAGPEAWASSRQSIVEWLTDERHRGLVEPHLHPLESVRMTLPFTVADYVDFYASEAHAANVGRTFRPNGEPLTPNWKHLPIGYHGRSGTVVVSRAEVRRPAGQWRDADGAVRFGPTQRLDLEAEVGFVVGVGSSLGTPVAVSEFRQHVFGACLVNDWSARDIQAWENVPLGPFLGKSFATSVSAWVTPLAALTEAWTAPPRRTPAPLPYLDDSAQPAGLDIELEVRLNGQLISRPPFASHYWTPAQMLAHLTVNGASVRTGDLFASGTVSGALPDQYGSLLELTRNGAEPLQLADGNRRAFLHDGDEVRLSASARGPHGRIGLGAVHGRVAPALDHGR